MALQINDFRQFNAVGFTIHHQIDFERLLKLALERGRAIPTLTGKYIAWQPGNGAELWVKVKDRSVISCTPFYSGESSLRIEALSFHARSEGLADGALRGAILSEEESSVAYPIVADIPGFESIATRLVLPQTVAFQAAAFIQQMRCFASEAAFDSWRRKQSSDMLLGADTLTFPDFAQSEPLPDGIPTANAAVTGRVLKADMLNNPITNQNFIALVVRAPGGGTLDVVADPQTASGELTVGGVIEGTCWIGGRILEGSPSAPETPQKSGHSPVLSRLTHWVRGS